MKEEERRKKEEAWDYEVWKLEQKNGWESKEEWKLAKSYLEEG